MKRILINILLGTGLILSLAALIWSNGNADTDRATSNATVTVEKLDEVQLEKLLTAYKGKVLLINVWASWCKPCREEFPDLVKLDEHYRGKDVKIVSISADFPEDVEDKVIPLIAELGVKFPVYVQAFKKADAFIDRMNEKWNGALPATFIYDKSGKQRQYVLGKKNYEYFRGEIDKLR